MWPTAGGEPLRVEIYIALVKLIEADGLAAGGGLETDGNETKPKAT